MASRTPPKDRDGFGIAIVCALKLERDAVEAVMDVDFREQGRTYGKASHDRNAYTTGVLGGKAVVLAYPRDMGTLNAAIVASDMRHSFKNIRLCLVVGITGGAPQTPDGFDILLGDLIVSTTVIQYDFGRHYPDGFRRKKEIESTLGRMNVEIGSFLAYLEGAKASKRVALKTLQYKLEAITTSELARPDPGDDLLFPSDYRHKHQALQACEICSKCERLDDAVCEEAESSTCEKLGCDKSLSSFRKRDSSQSTSSKDIQSRPIRIHFGRVASSNGVLKSGVHRDKLAATEQVIAFEMEGAGTWDQFPTVVVKSVCDYADSHKNKTWQAHAAMTAASGAKAILEEWEMPDVVTTGTADEVEHVTKMYHSMRISTDGKERHPGSPIVYLPFTRNRQFVGRTTELDMLKRKLLIDSDCQTAAVVGLGGIGKTQVALSFAYSVLEEFSNFSVFWIPALSRETFQQSISEIARTLGITNEISDGQQDALELVRRHLSTASAGRWLLIVDNADDLKTLDELTSGVSLLDCLPKSTLGLTLFTTRSHEVAQSVAGTDVIEVERMNPQEAMNLLQSALVRKGLLEDRSLAIELLDELDNLPLAITQATAYMNVKKISISDYLELLRSTEEDMVHLLSTEMRDGMRYRQAASAVATTWLITFRQIVEQDAAAADLLRFISCIEWKAIPYSLLPRIKPKARETSAIGMLCSYSFLVERCDEKMYDMHRLVHLATRVWNDRYNDSTKVHGEALLHLANTLPSDRFEYRIAWRQYLPHVACIRQRTTERCFDAKGLLYLKVGRYLLSDDKSDEAVTWLEESCYWRRELEETDPDRLKSQLTLARAYRKSGMARSAIELLRHVVETPAAAVTEDDEPLLDSYYQLAMAYRCNDQLDEAIELLEDILAKCRNSLAGDNRSRLSLERELGGAYKLKGRTQDAIEMLERVFTIQMKILEEHPGHQQRAPYPLSSVYQDIGKHGDAIKLLKYVFTACEQLEDDDPRRLRSQDQLASAYICNNQIEDAINLLKDIVAIGNTTFPEGHYRQLRSQHDLATAYRRNGQYEDAIGLLEPIVTIDNRTLPEDHKARLASQHALATAYRHNGQIEDAIRLLEYIVPISARTTSHRTGAWQRELDRAYLQRDTGDADMQDMDTENENMEDTDALRQRSEIGNHEAED